jgi:hypothetical protein
MAEQNTFLSKLKRKDKKKFKDTKVGIFLKDKALVQYLLVMEKYANKFLLPSPRYIHKDLILQAVNETHSTNLPRKLNDIRSDANEAVASSNLLLEATELYQQVIEKIGDK